LAREKAKKTAAPAIKNAFGARFFFSVPAGEWTRNLPLGKKRCTCPPAIPGESIYRLPTGPLRETRSLALSGDRFFPKSGVASEIDRAGSRRKKEYQWICPPLFRTGAFNFTDFRIS